MHLYYYYLKKSLKFILYIFNLLWLKLKYLFIIIFFKKFYTQVVYNINVYYAYFLSFKQNNLKKKYL